MLAFAFETITSLGRFVFKLQAQRDFRWLGKFSFGYRIHHGYWGVILILTAMTLFSGIWRDYLMVVGWALFVSDFVHHFFILKPITGHHEFYIKYHD